MSIFSIVFNLLFPRDGFWGDKYIHNFEGLKSSKKDNLIICSSEIDVLKLIKRAKIKGEWDICRDFSQLIEYNLVKYKLKNIDLITFVPGDKIREKLRGYHIPKIISRKLSKITGIKYQALLKKIKHTKSQAKLNKADRLTNNLGVFKNIEYNKINPTKILIVDDIYTTGSTINEVEKALLDKYKNTKIIKICIYSKQSLD